MTEEEQMSDTPRTDNIEARCSLALGLSENVVWSSFARQLERELNEARKLAEEGRLGHIPSNQTFPWENA